MVAGRRAEEAQEFSAEQWLKEDPLFGEDE